MKKQLTYKQLKRIIKECACEAMQDAHMGEMPMVKMIKLGKPMDKAGLFPGMDLDHHDDVHTNWDDEDQGEKGMILSNLAKMSDKAQELQDLAAEVDDNEEWVQDKIAVAASMIDSVHSYLKYRK